MMGAVHARRPSRRDLQRFVVKLNARASRILIGSPSGSENIMLQNLFCGLR